jgi:hypothetical protein
MGSLVRTKPACDRGAPKRPRGRATRVAVRRHGNHAPGFATAERVCGRRALIRGLPPCAGRGSPRERRRARNRKAPRRPRRNDARGSATQQARIPGAARPTESGRQALTRGRLPSPFRKAGAPRERRRASRHRDRPQFGRQAPIRRADALVPPQSRGPAPETPYKASPRQRQVGKRAPTEGSRRASPCAEEGSRASQASKPPATEPPDWIDTAASAPARRRRDRPELGRQALIRRADALVPPQSRGPAPETPCKPSPRQAANRQAALNRGQPPRLPLRGRGITRKPSLETPCGRTTRLDRHRSQRARTPSPRQTATGQAGPDPTGGRPRL